MDPMTTTTETPNLLKKTVALSVRFRGPRQTARVNPNAIQTDADRDLLAITKRLFECKQMRAVANFDGSVREHLRMTALPGLLRAGMYLIPTGMVTEISTWMEQAAQERAKLVDAFVEVYPAAVADARTRLGTLFNASDYPSAEALRGAFKLDWQYLSFDTPGSLQAIKAELFEQEKAKAAARWTEAESEIKNLVRVQMQELVHHMVERLTPGEDGKPKVFRNTLVENLNGFLATFEPRNVTGDDDLSALVGKARVLLAGVDAKVLRDVDAVRDEVAKGFVEIKEKLDGMVVNKPTRLIDFDEA